MNSLRLFLIAGVLFSWMAASQAVAASNGTIRFYGAIVEGACSINVVKTAANTECFRNGKNHTGVQDLTTFSTSSKELPLNLGKSEMKWLDQDKKLAIMTVDYR